MYAIVDFKGKQFKVQKGRCLDVPKMQQVEQDQEVDLNKVLLWCNDDGAIQFGRPYLSGITVKAKIIQTIIKEKKIIVFKHKRAKNYRRKQGHRQQMTRLEIKDLYQR